MKGQLCYIGNEKEFDSIMIAVTGINLVHFEHIDNTFDGAKKDIRKTYKGIKRFKCLRNLARLKRMWKNPKYRFDPIKFDWSAYSWVVASHTPHLIFPELFNWKRFSWCIEIWCPELMKFKPE